MMPQMLMANQTSFSGYPGMFPGGGMCFPQPPVTHVKDKPLEELNEPESTTEPKKREHKPKNVKKKLMKFTKMWYK